MKSEKMLFQAPSRIAMPAIALGVGARKMFRTALAAVLVAFAFVLVISTAAMADTVSGRVYGVDGKPVANGAFTAKPVKGDAVQFKTDAAGTFSTYLDAGRYVITLNGSADAQGTIDSYPQPVQTDIHLKKEGK